MPASSGPRARATASSRRSASTSRPNSAWSVHRPAGSRPTRSRVATSTSAAGPSSWRSAHIALRRLPRALLSSTSGQKRAARSPRGCSPGCSANHASSDHVRRPSVATVSSPASTSIAPSSRTCNTRQLYARCARRSERIAAMPRLVGRAREIEALDGALARLRSGDGGVVAIAGEPGIGKSRLLAELSASADDCLVLGAAASEFEQDLPYAMWTEAIDPHLRGLDDRRFARLGIADAEALPLLGERGVTDRHRVHRALRDLLERLAGARPLVLWLDDVQWADGASVDALAALVRRPSTGAVLLAIAAREGGRPPAVDAALSTAGREGRVTALTLAPLSEAEAGELIGADAAPIYALSGGNPFYLEQLARSAGVPESVTLALTGELAALPDEARLVLEGAAVAGDPFEPALAAEAAGVSEADALRALDELLARALVRPAGGTRRFAFRHPVVRHAVYEGAPGGWRLAAHARAAAALERRGAGLIARAHHVEHAAPARRRAGVRRARGRGTGAPGPGAGVVGALPRGGAARAPRRSGDAGAPRGDPDRARRGAERGGRPVERARDAAGHARRGDRPAGAARADRAGRQHGDVVGRRAAVAPPPLRRARRPPRRAVARPRAAAPLARAGRALRLRVRRRPRAGERRAVRRPRARRPGADRRGVDAARDRHRRGRRRGRRRGPRGGGRHVRAADRRAGRDPAARPVDARVGRQRRGVASPTPWRRSSGPPHWPRPAAASRS